LDKDSIYNEQEILSQVVQGNQRAFVLLVEHYTPAVFAHVLTYIKNASRSEEITQDIFLKVWKHRSELLAINNFRGYLFVITRNSTISAFREKIMKWEDAQKDELETTSLNPAGAIEYRQLSETILKGVELLPPRRKQVFKMSRFDNLSYEEIAKALSISKSAVNQHIVESLLFLRTFLRNQMLFITGGFLLYIL